MTTTNRFASYLEELERAGVSGLRSLDVPLLANEEKLHLRRSSGIRLCDWRTGGEALTFTADELTQRDDLCEGCFPGAFGTWQTLHDLSTAGAISLAGLVIETVTEARKSIHRVEKGQRVASSKLYSALHSLRLLQQAAGNARQWPSAPPELLESLGQRAGGTLQDLRTSLTRETHRTIILERVRASQARLKEQDILFFDADAEYLIAYPSDITQVLTTAPMLASDVVATYQIPQEKGITVLVTTGEVAEYLNRVGRRAKDWRLNSFQANVVPDDPIVRETAIGIWDPAGTGELKSFEKAVAAAQALHGK